MEPKNCLQPIVKCLPENLAKRTNLPRQKDPKVSGTHVTRVTPAAMSVGTLGQVLTSN